MVSSACKPYILQWKSKEIFRNILNNNIRPESYRFYPSIRLSPFLVKKMLSIYATATFYFIIHDNMFIFFRVFDLSWFV